MTLLFTSSWKTVYKQNESLFVSVGNASAVDGYLVSPSDVAKLEGLVELLQPYVKASKWEKSYDVGELQNTTGFGAVMYDEAVEMDFDEMRAYLISEYPESLHQTDWWNYFAYLHIDEAGPHDYFLEDFIPEAYHEFTIYPEYIPNYDKVHFTQYLYKEEFNGGTDTHVATLSNFTVSSANVEESVSFPALIGADGGDLAQELSGEYSEIWEAVVDYAYSEECIDVYLKLSLDADIGYSLTPKDNVLPVGETVNFTDIVTTTAWAGTSAQTVMMFNKIPGSAEMGSLETDGTYTAIFPQNDVVTGSPHVKIDNIELKMSFEKIEKDKNGKWKPLIEKAGVTVNDALINNIPAYKQGFTYQNKNKYLRGMRPFYFKVVSGVFGGNPKVKFDYPGESTNPVENRNPDPNVLFRVWRDKNRDSSQEYGYIVPMQSYILEKFKLNTYLKDDLWVEGVFEGSGKIKVGVDLDGDGPKEFRWIYNDNKKFYLDVDVGKIKGDNDDVRNYLDVDLFMISSKDSRVNDPPPDPNNPNDESREFLKYARPVCETLSNCVYYKNANQFWDGLKKYSEYFPEKISVMLFSHATAETVNIIDGVYFQCDPINENIKRFADDVTRYGKNKNNKQNISQWHFFSCHFANTEDGLEALETFGRKAKLSKVLAHSGCVFVDELGVFSYESNVEDGIGIEQWLSSE